MHPSANPNDLAFGRDRLKEAIESRSGALHRLVEENFDKFIGIKAATSNVYEEMKLQPLSREGDYSVGDLKESLQCASVAVSPPSILLMESLSLSCTI